MDYVDIPIPVEIPYEFLIIVGLTLITLVIAIYAAILSTAAVGWIFYNQFKAKENLDVVCYIAKLAIDGVIDPEETLVYKLTNTGAKSILIMGVGGKTKQGTFALEPENFSLPVELKPGRFVVLMASPSSLNILNETEFEDRNDIQDSLNKAISNTKK